MEIWKKIYRFFFQVLTVYRKLYRWHLAMSSRNFFFFCWRALSIWNFKNLWKLKNKIPKTELSGLEMILIWKLEAWLCEEMRWLPKCSKRRLHMKLKVLNSSKNWFKAVLNCEIAKRKIFQFSISIIKTNLRWFCDAGNLLISWCSYTLVVLKAKKTQALSISNGNDRWALLERLPQGARRLNRLANHHLVTTMRSGCAA